MANKISDKKRDAMWVAFQEKQNNQNVADKCRVSRQTVRRYRVKDNWDERYAKILVKAQKIADEDSARRKARHIKLTQISQKQGVDSITQKDKSGKLIPLKPRDGIQALFQGIREERKICGDADAAQIEDKEFTLNIHLVSNYE